ncbi:putative secreted protein with PEP-CTERM sorting signal [Neobacillus bataviensis]|jgi:hypothetical protein|uniref:Putative secreted protein with PEP-CTERM sorting signal n=1 Tax=Neobacillus bataviensis TaxID=220685 RepID=A0A561CXX0_9BACI|nr:putative secreted protein with PEP-CTERM sorting signal [Neobacillus bataviensis]
MSKWGSRMAGVVLIGAGIGFLFRKRKGEHKE